MEIYAQGQKKQMEGFLKALEIHPPKRAAILKINTEDVTAETDMHFETFDIIESEKTKGEIFVSPDIAICEECKEEMCIHLSTVPAVDQDLPFWMRCPMTGNGRA